MRMRAKYVRVVVASPRDVAERYAEQYCHREGGWREGALASGKTARQTYDELCKLGPMPDAKAVEAVMGNKSWTNILCESCCTYVERGVELGEHEGKVYCETCLKEALHVLSEVSP